MAKDEKTMAVRDEKLKNGKRSTMVQGETLKYDMRTIVVVQDESLNYGGACHGSAVGKLHMGWYSATLCSRWCQVQKLVPREKKRPLVGFAACDRSERQEMSASERDVREREKL